MINNGGLYEGGKRVCGGKKVQQPGLRQGCPYRQLELVQGR